MPDPRLTPVVISRVGLAGRNLPEKERLPSCLKQRRRSARPVSPDTAMAPLLPIKRGSGATNNKERNP